MAFWLEGSDEDEELFCDLIQLNPRSYFLDVEDALSWHPVEAFVDPVKAPDEPERDRITVWRGSDEFDGYYDRSPLLEIINM